MDSHSVIGTIESSSIYLRYELEHPERIVIIQDYYFLKDAAHFNAWLTNQVESTIVLC